MMLALRYNRGSSLPARTAAAVRLGSCVAGRGKQGSRSWLGAAVQGRLLLAQRAGENDGRVAGDRLKKWRECAYSVTRGSAARCAAVGRTLCGGSLSPLPAGTAGRRVPWALLLLQSTTTYTGSSCCSRLHVHG